jgi:hypothetical protein
MLEPGKMPGSAARGWWFFGLGFNSLACAHLVSGFMVEKLRNRHGIKSEGRIAPALLADAFHPFAGAGGCAGTPLVGW